MPQRSRPNLTCHARSDRWGGPPSAWGSLIVIPAVNIVPAGIVLAGLAAAHIALHVFLLARRPIPRGWPDVGKLGMTMASEVMSPRAKAALPSAGHLSSAH